MVVRVYGTCNGEEVSFQKKKEYGFKSTWTITVPKVPSGQYVIELYAVDEVGNTGYFATIKMIFDATMMRYNWVIMDIGEIWSLEDVTRILGNNYSSH